MEVFKNTQRYPRFVPRRAVTIAIEQGTRRVYGVAKNISEGGLCVVSDEDLKPGSTFHLKLSFPHQDVLEAEGRIVWNSAESGAGARIPNGHVSFNILNGVEFSELPSVVRQRLHGILFASDFAAET